MRCVIKQQQLSSHFQCALLNQPSEIIYAHLFMYLFFMVKDTSQQVFGKHTKNPGPKKKQLGLIGLSFMYSLGLLCLMQLCRDGEMMKGHERISLYADQELINFAVKTFMFTTLKYFSFLLPMCCIVIIGVQIILMLYKSYALVSSNGKSG